MKRFLCVLLTLLALAGNCFAGEFKDRLVKAQAAANPNLKQVQVYIDCSSVWEQKTLGEFKKVLEGKFPANQFKVEISPEFAAAVEILRDEDPFFTSSDNKSLAMRTQDWKKIAEQKPCDYIVYCKIIRGNVKSKLNYNVLFLTSTTKVELDSTVRVYNVAKGEYTYATKYHTIGKSHNTTNFERAERKAIMDAFTNAKFNIQSI